MTITYFIVIALVAALVGYFVSVGLAVFLVLLALIAWLVTNSNMR